jgi:DNA polymerase-3 subunit gamma/tau
MATYLHNSDIAFEIRLAKAEEIKPILSRKETFDKMRTENEAIERLRELLDLELA